MEGETPPTLKTAASFKWKKIKFSVAISNAAGADKAETVAMRLTKVAMTDEDIIVVKQGWNKLLAWKDAVFEAVFGRWVLRHPALREILGREAELVPGDLFALIDHGVSLLHPHTEVIQRETYRRVLENGHYRFNSKREFFEHFTVLGVKPSHWVTLEECYRFALSTHVPYFQDSDYDDLRSPGNGSSQMKFLRSEIIIPFFETYRRWQRVYKGKLVAKLSDWWKAQDEFSRQLIGTFTANRVRTVAPSLEDFFRGDPRVGISESTKKLMDVLASCGSDESFSVTVTKSGIENDFSHIPHTEYGTLRDCIAHSLTTSLGCPAEIMEQAQELFGVLFKLLSTQQFARARAYKKAQEWIETFAKEKSWSEAQTRLRLSHIQLEIDETGTYTHTSEEIECGARVAWRNSAKCIGRAAWNTLIVRDMRHVTEPKEIFDECVEHLRQATCGPSIQAIMTVFQARRPGQTFGTRIWNSQLIRYAGYRNEDGSVLGDPANLHLTEAIVGLGWNPPEPKSQFDILPIVIQPEGGEPQMFTLPKESSVEVSLEHPTRPEFASLGLKWLAVPTISAFNLKIGGVDYVCCPFNGWFMEMEIARNLMERYDAGPKICGALGIPMSDYQWKDRSWLELTQAVTHSFRKSKLSIVDHHSCSEQFLNHCKLELSAGREVPAQWSWIGGFVGVLCPVWGYEMRDFWLNPQYHYQSETFLVQDLHNLGIVPKSEDQNSGEAAVYHILVLYGTETGTSELYARQVSRALKHLKPRLMSLDECAEEMETNLQWATHVIVVVSTFGDGDAPGNATQFVKKALPSLKTPDSQTQYTVLALGNSGYVNFCRAGFRVDKMLEEASGKRFLPLTTADEIKDQKATFTKWFSSVIAFFPSSGPVEEEITPFVVLPSHCSANLVDAPPKTLGKRLPCPVVVHEQLVKDLKHADDHRSVIHLSVDISQTQFEYNSGDYLVVSPINSPQDVAELCSAIGATPDTWITVQNPLSYSLPYPVPITLNTALAYYYDISLQPPYVENLLKALRRKCPESDIDSSVTIDKWLEDLTDDSGMVKDNARLALQKSICDRYLTIAGLLRGFDFQLDVVSLFNALSTLKPRYYSISSSSLSSPKEVHVTIRRYTEPAGKGVRRGICSSFVENLASGRDIYCDVRFSTFRLPEDPSCPIIICCAGTGISPFMSFLEDREVLGKTRPLGKCLFFYGCRTRGDYLYAEKLMAWEASGVISVLKVAFSQEPRVPKKYIQDVIKDSAAETWEVLSDLACNFFLCGHPRLEIGCKAAFVHAARTVGRLSTAEARKLLTRMEVEGRQHLDVWGT